MSAIALSESAREYTQGTTSMLIGAEWVQAASGETFPVYDPATGGEIARRRAAAPRTSTEPSPPRGGRSRGRGSGSPRRNAAR